MRVKFYEHSIVRRHFAVLVAAGMLAGCSSVSDLPVAASLSSGPEVIVREGENGTEVVLHPIGLWDDNPKLQSKLVSIGGIKFYARLMDKNALFQRRFAKAGLFWDAKINTIFMPVIIEGPSVSIRGAELTTQGYRAQLKVAPNFTFSPVGKTSGDSEQSLAAFIVTPKALNAVASASAAQLILKTSRGNLRLGLDVSAGETEVHLRSNARLMFQQFAQQLAQEKQNG